MADELHGMRVAFVVANEGIEQVELTEPWRAVQNAGGRPELVAPKPGTARAMNHLDWADEFPVDRTTADAHADDYDAMVLPGGVANPDQLRLDKPAMRLLHEVAEAGKPIAVICHGPWSLIDAGVARGRTMTSWPSLRTDLTNAGTTWVDREVVVCDEGPNRVVSSREPGDLPAFCATFVDVFAQRPVAH